MIELIEVCPAGVSGLARFSDLPCALALVPGRWRAEAARSASHSACPLMAGLPRPLEINVSVMTLG